MMQAAEKKSIPGFYNEKVYPTGKLRQLVCHGFPTYGSQEADSKEAKGTKHKLPVRGE